MNGLQIQVLDNALETAALRSVKRVIAAANEDGDPNPLDVLVASDYRARVMAGQAKGPWALAKAHAPTLGLGTGLGALLVAAIEALGRIFGR